MKINSLNDNSQPISNPQREVIQDKSKDKSSPKKGKNKKGYGGFGNRNKNNGGSTVNMSGPSIVNYYALRYPGQGNF